MPAPQNTRQSDECGVVILRPAAQAQKLIQTLKQDNFNALSFPTITIRAFTDSRYPQVVSRLGDFDFIIFISRNAVDFFIPLLPAAQLKLLQQHSDTHIAAIGAATAASLDSFDLSPGIFPDGKSDSESLLSLAQLQSVKDKNILIVRGRGGREKLFDALRSRDARVEYLEVYERVPADSDCRTLLHAWDNLQVIVATSGNILDNLIMLTKNCPTLTLTDKTLLVISERLQQYAATLGFEKIILADGAGDAQIINRLKDYRDNS